MSIQFRSYEQLQWRWGRGLTGNMAVYAAPAGWCDRLLDRSETAPPEESLLQQADVHRQHVRPRSPLAADAWALQAAADPPCLSPSAFAQ